MRTDLSLGYPGFDAPPLTRLLAVPFADRLPRRRFLISSAVGGIACATGCSSQPQETPATSRPSDVPLRVLLCGSSAWADAISTAWGGVAEQPLMIDAIDPTSSGAAADGPVDSQHDGQGFGSQVAEKMKVSDLAIVPCGLLPELTTSRAFTPLGTAFMDEAQLGADAILPVLREASMRWAGEAVGIPLGSAQPALLISGETAADSLEIPKTWEAFIETAERLQTASRIGEPVVAEPLAGGAAAKMFLWRASDAAPAVWLFNRETFEPVLSDEVYVQTLETMRACAELYGDQRLTPGEVWQRIASGQLKMAIGWPGSSGDPPRVESLGDALVSSLPRASEADADQAASPPRPVGVMADPDAPVALLSSRCRQTAAAKRFLIWLAGGEGSQMVRDAAPSMTVLRTAAESAPQSSGGGSYSDYLRGQLASLQVRPTLRLHRYDRYLAALDQQVLACLDGKASAQAALAAATEAWQALTAEVGAKVQAQAWRQAQGLRN